MHKKLTGLYAITPATQTDTQKLFIDVEQALLGGAKIIQYRDKSNNTQHRHKTAIALRELTHKHDALLIINDDPQLAKLTNADGVHLGADDANIKTSRTLLGEKAIIGISCYNRFELAQQASQQGADYVAFGRFFPSHTKPGAEHASIDLLRRAQQELNIPIVAIGGVTAENGDSLINAGAHMLAVVNDIFGHADIRMAAKNYQPLFRNPQHKNSQP